MFVFFLFYFRVSCRDFVIVIDSQSLLLIVSAHVRVVFFGCFRKVKRGRRQIEKEIDLNLLNFEDVYFSTTYIIYAIILYLKI